MFPISGSGSATPPFPPPGPAGHGAPFSQVLWGCYDFPFRMPVGLFLHLQGPHVPACSCPP